MIPDLGRYAVEVSLAYGVSLGLIGALVGWVWCVASACGESWKKPRPAQGTRGRTMPRINPLMVIPPLMLAGFVAFIAVGNLREDRDALPSARAGQAAPAVALEEMPGRAPFTDDLIRSGEVTLVNFWGSWCPPCRAEHPVLEDLAASGVTVLGVNYRDQSDRAEDFLLELGDPFAAIGADPRARMGLDWGVVGLPETFVVDGSGQIILRYAGPITDEIVASRIRPAMERAATN